VLRHRGVVAVSWLSKVSLMMDYPWVSVNF